MFAWNQAVAIAVMMAAGGLGGYASLLFARRRQAAGGPVDPAEPPPIGVRDSIIAGIAAAFAVPLLLAIAATGSEVSLVAKIFEPHPLCCPSGDEDCRAFFANLLVLSGFCIAAGASARAIISRLGASLLGRIEATETKVEALQAVAADIVEPLDVAAADVRAAAAEAAPALAGADLAILRSLATDPRVRRTAEWVARETGLDAGAVEAGLKALEVRHLVASFPSLRNPQTRVWGVAAAGLTATRRGDPVRPPEAI